MTPLEAYLRVTGEAQSLPDIESKAIERGNRLESLVLDYPAEKLDLIRKPAPFRSHPDYDWTGDSADALYYDGDELVSVGEGKTCNMAIGASYGVEGTDEIPDSTLLQSHWHLLHWPETDTCHVPVLVGGYTFEFRLYRVKRDPEFLGILLQDLERWYRDHVVPRKPPPAEAGDTDWIAQQLAKWKPGKHVPDSPELRSLIKEKVAASELKRAATEREERAKNRIKMLVGEAESCRAYWGSLHYKPNSRTVTDWQAIARELGCTNEDVQKHTTIAPTQRILRIYPKKGVDL